MRAGLLGSREPRSQTSLWRQQDSVSTGMQEILAGGFVTPRGALLWSPQREAHLGGQGGRAEVSTITIGHSGSRGG